MGFYSIYKLIKDVIRTLFGNKVVKILLIVLIIMFFLALQSTKVQATYISDTYNWFDYITPISNETTISLSNMTINIPSSYYDYKTIFLKPRYINGQMDRCYIFIGNGDLYFDFSSYKFYSDEVFYRGFVTLQGTTAYFTDPVTSYTSYSVGSGISGMYVTDSPNNYYSALKGSIYDYSNNSLIVSSSGSSIDYDSDYEYTINNSTATINLTNLKDNYFYFVCTKGSNDYLWYQYVYCDKKFTLDTSTSMFVCPAGCKAYIGFGTINQNSLSNLQNTIDSIDLSSATVQNSTYYINYFPTYATGNGAISIEDAVVFTNFNLKNQNNDIQFPNYFAFPPFFSNTSNELSSLSFNNLFVELADWNINKYNLYIHVLQISDTVTENNEVIYYYNDKTIELEKNNKYYKQLFDSDTYYFSVSKSALGLDVDKSYILVLNISNNQISNSIGIIEKNVSDGVFEAVQIDTAGIITQAEADHDIFLQNEQHLQDIANGVGKTGETINNAFNNTTISSDTETDIDTSLGFDNNNTVLDNIRNGFFSRLTNMLTNIFDYDISEVDTIALPIRNQNIEIKSDMISAYIPTTLYVIIQAMWYFIFNFYLFKYLSNLYHELKSGGIIDGFSTDDDIITKGML